MVLGSENLSAVVLDLTGKNLKNTLARTNVNVQSEVVV